MHSHFIKGKKFDIFNPKLMLEELSHTTPKYKLKYM
jgi:hypothetical protein